jgi:hypothetical protein
VGANAEPEEAAASAAAAANRVLRLNGMVLADELQWVLDAMLFLLREDVMATAARII